MKPDTQWIPAGGVGYVVAQPGVFFQDNLANLLIDNLGNNLVPNPQYVTGKPQTSWTAHA